MLSLLLYAFITINTACYNHMYMYVYIHGGVHSNNTVIPYSTTPRMYASGVGACMYIRLYCGI